MLLFCVSVSVSVFVWMMRKANSPYVIEHSLGTGAYGSVFFTRSPTKRPLALKIPEYSRRLYTCFTVTEATVLPRLRHCHIVSVDEEWQTASSFSCEQNVTAEDAVAAAEALEAEKRWPLTMTSTPTATDACFPAKCRLQRHDLLSLWAIPMTLGHGDLHQILRGKRWDPAHGGPIKDATLLLWCDQLMQAVWWLHHEQQLSHNDIKPSNVLLMDVNHIVLADLGSVVRTAMGKNVSVMPTITTQCPQKLASYVVSRAVPGFFLDLNDNYTATLHPFVSKTDIPWPAVHLSDAQVACLTRRCTPIQSDLWSLGVTLAFITHPEHQYLFGMNEKDILNTMNIYLRHPMKFLHARSYLYAWSDFLHPLPHKRCWPDAFLYDQGPIRSLQRQQSMSAGGESSPPPHHHHQIIFEVPSALWEFWIAGIWRWLHLAIEVAVDEHKPPRFKCVYPPHEQQHGHWTEASLITVACQAMWIAAHTCHLRRDDEPEDLWLGVAVRMASMMCQIGPILSMSQLAAWVLFHQHHPTHPTTSLKNADRLRLDAIAIHQRMYRFQSHVLWMRGCDMRTLAVSLPHLPSWPRQSLLQRPRIISQPQFKGYHNPCFWFWRRIWQSTYLSTTAAVHPQKR